MSPRKRVEEFDSSQTITEEGHQGQQSTFDTVFLFPASQPSQLGITCVNYSIFLPNTVVIWHLFLWRSLEAGLILFFSLDLQRTITYSCFWFLLGCVWLCFLSYFFLKHHKNIDVTPTLWSMDLVSLCRIPLPLFLQ